MGSRSGLGICVAPTVRQSETDRQRRGDALPLASTKLNLPFWDPSLSQLFVDWLAGRLIYRRLTVPNSCFIHLPVLREWFAAPLTFRRTMHRLGSVQYSKHR